MARREVVESFTGNAAAIYPAAQTALPFLPVRTHLQRKIRKNRGKYALRSTIQFATGWRSRHYRSNDNRTTVPEHPSATRNPDRKNSGNSRCAISKTTPKANRASMERRDHIGQRIASLPRTDARDQGGGLAVIRVSYMAGRRAGLSADLYHHPVQLKTLQACARSFLSRELLPSWTDATSPACPQAS